MPRFSCRRSVSEVVFAINVAKPIGCAFLLPFCEWATSSDMRESPHPTKIPPSRSTHSQKQAASGFSKSAPAGHLMPVPS